MHIITIIKTIIIVNNNKTVITNSNVIYCMTPLKIPVYYYELVLDSYTYQTHVAQYQYKVVMNIKPYQVQD